MVAFTTLSASLLLALSPLVSAHPPATPVPTSLVKVVRRSPSAPSITPRAIPASYDYCTASSGGVSTSKVLDAVSQVDVNCEQSAALDACIRAAIDTCQKIAQTNANNCFLAGQQTYKCASVGEKEQCCEAAFGAYFGGGQSQGECDA
ncbi:hypothetical protein JCM6882_008221 [Rhodosporidiobolus microsporus]